MAEIDLVPKHRSRTWLWVLLAIVIIIAIGIWAFSGRGAALQLKGVAPPAALSVVAPGTGLPHR